MARYVAPARSTALAEVARLLDLAGASAAFHGDGTLVVVAGDPVSKLALRYGREVLDTRADAPATPPAAEYVVVGEGAGSPGSGQGLWPTSDFWAGGAADPGPDARRRAAHEIGTVADARAAGAAWAARQAADRAPVRLRCRLAPAVVPDAAVELQDAPDDLGVEAIRVRHVVHRIDPLRGAVTDLRGHDAGAAGAGGLLGGLSTSIAGAAGGLL
jgi:hypothetical protein